MICRYCGTRAQSGTIRWPCIGETEIQRERRTDEINRVAPTIGFQWACPRCYEVSDNSDLTPVSVITDWHGLYGLSRGFHDMTAYRWFITSGATRIARAMTDDLGNSLWEAPVTQGAPQRFAGFLAKFMLHERGALVSFGHRQRLRVWHELRGGNEAS